MKSLVSRVALTAPLVIVLLAWAAHTTTTAWAWEIQARCEQQRVVGSIDIPHDAGNGLPYNVFVEQLHPDGHRSWVEGAGQDITQTGRQSFSLDVRKAVSEAVQLRIRYKDKNGRYGPEFKDLAPCPVPTATPTSTPVTPTVTNTPLSTSTPVTPTSTPVTPTRTSVPPTNTATVVPNTPVLPSATPVRTVGVPETVCPANRICLPNTGDGAEYKQGDSNPIARYVIVSLLALATAAFGGFLFLRRQARA